MDVAPHQIMHAHLDRALQHFVELLSPARRSSTVSAHSVSSMLKVCAVAASMVDMLLPVVDMLLPVVDMLPPVGHAASCGRHATSYGRHAASCGSRAGVNAARHCC